MVHMVTVPIASMNQATMKSSEWPGLLWGTSWTCHFTNDVEDSASTPLV